MLWRIILALAALTVSLLSGCNSTGANRVNAGSPAVIVPPVVGSWSGKSELKGGDLQKVANELAGGPLTGHSSLTLNADTTGFLKVADQPERPIAWKLEGQKIILQVQSLQPDSHEGNGGPWVGTLSSDGRTMTIDMEQVRVILTKTS